MTTIAARGVSPWVTRAEANDLPGQAYAGTAAWERGADSWDANREEVIAFEQRVTMQRDLRNRPRIVTTYERGANVNWDDADGADPFRRNA